jgi:hypothetical protein
MSGVEYDVLFAIAKPSYEANSLFFAFAPIAQPNNDGLAMAKSNSKGQRPKLSKKNDYDMHYVKLHDHMQ